MTGIRRRTITAFSLIALSFYVLGISTMSLVFLKMKYVKLPVGTIFVPIFQVI